MLEAFLAHHRAERERLEGEAVALQEEIEGLEAKLRGAHRGRGEALDAGATRRPLRLIRVPPLGFCYNSFQRRAEAPRQPFLGPAREGITEIVVEESQRAALTRYFASLPLKPPTGPSASERSLADPLPALFLFHYFFDRNFTWTGMTLPPRQTRRVGLFSCRTPHRPNSLGQSLGVIISCKVSGGLCSGILVKGLDTLNGTPILALTHYSTEMDCGEARGGWMDQDRLLSLYYDEVSTLNRVYFSQEAERACVLIQELGLARGLREAILAKLERTHPLSRSHKAKSLAGEGKAFVDAFGGFKVVYTCDQLEEGRAENTEPADATKESPVPDQETQGTQGTLETQEHSTLDNSVLSICVTSISPTLSREKAEAHKNFDPEAAVLWKFYLAMEEGESASSHP